MNNQTILAIVIALSAAIEGYELQKISPMIWPPSHFQAASLCTGSDPDGGCPSVDPSAWVKAP
jgi:hypothetical protein